MNFTRQFHQVSRGRVFVRGAKATPAKHTASQEERARYSDPLMLVGVIEVPKDAQLEAMHSVRLNSCLWLDIEEAREPSTYRSAEELRESDLGSLLTNVKFRRHALPDSFEVFLRGTHLPDGSPDTRWGYIAGAVPSRLAALPQEGLYEFNRGQDGFRLVDGNIFIGQALNTILRTPMWGPRGEFGLATSMEPEAYVRWIAAERAKPPRPHDDPKFRAFVELMEELAPSRLCYSADDWRAREALSREVLTELLVAEAEVDAAGVRSALQSPPKTADDALRAASLLRRRP
jgi:hypothetical protein